jgi:hypothetical protein
LKRFVQFLQTAITCGILVILIFSIPAVMAAMPIHLDISFANPGHVLGSRESGNGQVPSLMP